MFKYKLHDVFLSYRRFEDEARTDDQGTRIAEAVYHYLKDKGLEVFWDQPEMETGSFVDQLQWQLEHCPNYIFIGTENAKRFRKAVPPDRDYVAEEVRYAIRKIHEEEKVPNRSRYRTILHIMPRKSKMQKEKEDKGLPSPSEPYPPEIHELLYTQQGIALHDELPSEKELSEILRYVTEVNRGNLWNAGSQWLEEMTKPGSRFARLSIDQTIMPFAGTGKDEIAVLPIRAHKEKKKDLPLLNAITKAKGHLYLIGEGGIGKTTALFSIMNHVYNHDGNDLNDNQFRLDGQVPLFVELSKAPDTYGRLYEGGHSTFIQRAVYQQIRKDLKVKQVSGAAVKEVQQVFNMDPDTAVKPIHDLFTQDVSAPEYLLLLDGLNEVSKTEIQYQTPNGDGTYRTGTKSVASMVLKEIKMLMEDCPNVRVILTSRSKAETSWSEKTTIFYLSGVKDKAIKAYLSNRKIPKKRIAAAMHNEKLKAVLRIPLFLTLYASLKGDEEILARGEILRLFFHQKKAKMYSEKGRYEAVDRDVDKAASADQPLRLTPDMINFILDFILPEIAWRMEQDGVFYLELRGKGDKEGLRKIIWRVLTDQGETAVCGENGRDAFCEYRMGSRGSSTRKTAGSLRRCLGNGDPEEQEEIVGGILECAVMSLGILRKNEIREYPEEYGFIHHHIRDYFAAVHQINHLRMAVYLQKYEDGETARHCLEDWSRIPFRPEVRCFIGEALGEPHNVPMCDEMGRWHYAVPEESCDRNLIRRGLDIFRGRFEGHDGYAVWNLMEILKDVRGNLTGEDLSRLDLTGVETSGIDLGAFGSAALLEGSKIQDAFFISQGHNDEITGIYFHPAGDQFVTVSDDGTIKIWDLFSAQLIKTVKRGRGDADSVCFNTNSPYILMASDDGKVKVLDAHDYSEVRTLDCHTEYVNIICMRPNGKQFAWASFDRIIRIWDTESWTEQASLSCDKQIEGLALRRDSDDKYPDNVSAVGYSMDGRHIIAVIRCGAVLVWNADTFDPEKTYITHQLKEGESLTDACFSPDLRHVIAFTSMRTILVWDASSGKEVKQVPPGYKRLILSGINMRYSAEMSGDNKLDIYDISTDEWLLQLEVSGRYLRQCVFSPDGVYAALLFDTADVEVFDLRAQRKLCGFSGRINEVMNSEFSHDGRSIAVACFDGTVKLWDHQQPKKIRTLKALSSPAFSAFFSSEDSRVAAVSGRSVTIWDAGSGRNSNELKKANRCYMWAAYSPDQKMLLTVSANAKMDIWDAETGKYYTTLETEEYWTPKSMDFKMRIRTEYAAFTQDGRFVLASSETGPITVWNVHERRMVQRIDESFRTKISFFERVSLNREKDLLALEECHGAVFLLTKKDFEIIDLSELHNCSGENIYYYYLSISEWGADIVRIREDTRDMLFRWADGSYTDTHPSIDPESRGIRAVYIRDHTTTNKSRVSNWHSVRFDYTGNLIAATIPAINTVKIIDVNTMKVIRIVRNITGLEVEGVDIRKLHPDSMLSDEVRERLREYGAIVDDQG